MLANFLVYFSTLFFNMGHLCIVIDMMSKYVGSISKKRQSFPTLSAFIVITCQVIKSEGL